MNTIRLLKELGARRRALAWPAVSKRIVREIVAHETARRIGHNRIDSSENGG